MSEFVHNRKSQIINLIIPSSNYNARMILIIKGVSVNRCTLNFLDNSENNSEFIELFRQFLNSIMIIIQNLADLRYQLVNSILIVYTINLARKSKLFSKKHPRHNHPRIFANF